MTTCQHVVALFRIPLTPPLTSGRAKQIVRQPPRPRPARGKGAVPVDSRQVQPKPTRPDQPDACHVALPAARSRPGTPACVDGSGLRMVSIRLSTSGKRSLFSTADDHGLMNLSISGGPVSVRLGCSGRNPYRMICIGLIRARGARCIDQS